MTLVQSINRSFNLLCASIVGLAGLAFAPEAMLEKDVPDKIDDALLFLLGACMVWWYGTKGRSYVRSMLPLGVVIIALLVKVMGVAIELDDAESVGDDFGGLILFIGATALVWYQYRKTKQLLAQSQ